MKRYQYYQPNAKDLKDEYGDCVIRALTKATGKTWLEVFDELQPISRELQAPYNVKPCYKMYLESIGFEYVGISNKKGTRRPTVDSFTAEHGSGTYVLRAAHHLVCSQDGKFYDTWDSGDACLYGYWKKC